MGSSESLDDATLARAMVASAAQSLDLRERRLVALRYYGDLSQAEIGCAVDPTGAGIAAPARGDRQDADTPRLNAPREGRLSVA